jgi:ABC-2 type transport system permease protein
MTGATVVAGVRSGRGVSWSALGGVIRYELLMQVRRGALWVGFLLLSAVLVVAFLSGSGPYLKQLGAPHRDLMIAWAVLANTFFALGAGLFLADRFPRDRRICVQELLASGPAGPGARLLGKYLGAVAATLVAAATFFAAGAIALIIQLNDLSLAPLALAAFLALIVPAVFFVGAFAIACTTFLWPPLFQFLFVGYMLWTGLNVTDIPTLSGTLLSPYLNYVVTGILGYHTFALIDARLYPASSVGLGLANIVVLLACAAVALLAAWGLEVWRVRRG